MAQQRRLESEQRDLREALARWLDSQDAAVEVVLPAMLFLVANGIVDCIGDHSEWPQVCELLVRSNQVLVETAERVWERRQRERGKK